VGRDDGYSDDIDWLDGGSDWGDDARASAVGQPTPPRRPWPRWFTLAIAVAVVAFVVAALNRERGTPSAARPSGAPTTPVPSTSAPSSTQAAPPTSAAATPPAALPNVSITQLPRPLFGATTGWELFGRGDNTLVRIEPAAGRITRTAVPDLLSGGAVYLLPDRNRVLIRPLDTVPSYVVADGKPAVEVPAVPNQNGPILPGPAPNQIWAERSDGQQAVMALTTLDGKRLGPFIPIPSESFAFDVTADGTGYLLYSGIGGVYEARPEGLRRISPGVLLAVGPSGWLVGECDARYRCQMVFIHRADGSRRIVPAEVSANGMRGVISPDGATVAMLTTGTQGVLGLYLLDLTSGRQRVIKVSVEQEFSDAGSLVFSPDSKWLLAVTSDRKLAVINRRTGAVGNLGIPLPALDQLALRPAR
jgi:hypothetical protein